MLWKTFNVADHQRVFIYQRGQFKQVLMPGAHRVSKLEGSITHEVFDVADIIFQHEKEVFLFSHYEEVLSEYLEQHKISDTEVGLFYRDDRLVDILPPDSRLTVWKGAERVRIDRIDISKDYRVDEQLATRLARNTRLNSQRALAASLIYTEVADQHVGLLIVNGKLEQALAPGCYGFWRYNRSIEVKLFDLRLQVIEVSGQEILTKDRVSLRINLTGSYTINDAQCLASKVKDHASFIYRELQLSLRETVGTQSLDVLLADKDALNAAINDSTRLKLADYGITLESVGVKDIILPGEMKLILNQVVQAQKEAEANVVKRREETQAMRSLHNTAKMMENNSVLLRLKELESLEKVTERIGNISVYGGLDGVLNDLVKIAPR